MAGLPACGDHGQVSRTQPVHCAPPRHPLQRDRHRRLDLGVYEVTQAEYEQVMGANPSWFFAKGVWLVPPEVKALFVRFE
jgi:hypothetical protein